MKDTRIAHNTAVLTGAGSMAIACNRDVDGEGLQIVGNIVWGERSASTCDGQDLESDNLYWAGDGDPGLTFDLAPSSRIADPLLVDPRGGDLRLRSDSPAIDAVRPMDLGRVDAVDADGVPVPQGLAPDIGAYEYRLALAPTPTADLTAASTAGLSAGVPTDPLEHEGKSATATTTPHPTTPHPATTPSPTDERRPGPTATPSAIPPPTGGPGSLDQFIVLAVLVGLGGLGAVVILSRRSPVSPP